MRTETSASSPPRAENNDSIRGHFRGFVNFILDAAFRFCAFQIPSLNFIFAVEVVSLLGVAREEVSLAPTLMVLSEFPRI